MAVTKFYGKYFLSLPILVPPDYVNKCLKMPWILIIGIPVFFLCRIPHFYTHGHGTVEGTARYRNISFIHKPNDWGSQRYKKRGAKIYQIRLSC